MRPVPPRSAARRGAAVPGVRSWLPVLGSRCRASSSVVGPGRTRQCSARPGLGKMTAALVIVPADPVQARCVSARRRRATGSPIGRQEVLTGTPWMVRLSMGTGDRWSPAGSLRPGQRLLRPID